MKQWNDKKLTWMNQLGDQQPTMEQQQVEEKSAEASDIKDKAQSADDLSSKSTPQIENGPEPGPQGDEKLEQQEPSELPKPEPQLKEEKMDTDTATEEVEKRDETGLEPKQNQEVNEDSKPELTTSPLKDEPEEKPEEKPVDEVAAEEKPVGEVATEEKPVDEIAAEEKEKGTDQPRDEPLNASKDDNDTELSDESDEADDQENAPANYDPNAPQCEHDANFGAICSYFLIFGPTLGLPFNIQELKRTLEDTSKGRFDTSRNLRAT